MLDDTLRIRGIHFAYLFGPPKVLDQEAALSVYRAISAELKRDDLSFRFKRGGEKPDQPGFQAVMEQREGKRGETLLLEGRGPGQPLRFLATMNFPESVKGASDLADMTTKGLWSAIGESWEIGVVEVRIRAQCSSGLPHAGAYLLNDALRVPPERVQALGGPIAFAGFQIDVAPPQEPETPMDRVAHSVKVEVLREDVRDLYLELVSQWSRLEPVQGAPGFVVSTGGGEELRQESAGRYVDAAFRFLEAKAMHLLGGDGGFDPRRLKFDLPPDDGEE